MGHGGAVVFEVDMPVLSRSPSDVTDSLLSAKADMPIDGGERRKWGRCVIWKDQRHGLRMSAFAVLSF